MLYRCPYEDVYACSKVGWFAHPGPGHGKKSGYATALAWNALTSWNAWNPVTRKYVQYILPPRREYKLYIRTTSISRYGIPEHL